MIETAWTMATDSWSQMGSLPLELGPLEIGANFDANGLAADSWLGVRQSSGLSAETMAASGAISSQIAASEWLGPMAPIALSPFFGLAALTGIATYGPDWLQERSSLFSESSALCNPVLFWTMIALAVLTSLPRLTKVSKPIALAAENLESYSAVIILVVVRFLGVSGGQQAETEALETMAMSTAAMPMLSAGFLDVPADVFMSLVAGLNVIVINVVKLFFEFLVWLIPIPTVDALLEAGNKMACAGLMGVYCYSPAIATLINLALLAVCLLVFGWVYRRLAYYRDVISGPVLAWLLPAWFRQRGEVLTAYCDACFEGLPEFTKVRIRKVAGENSETGYEVVGRWLWRAAKLTIDPCTVRTERGLVANKLTLIDAQGLERSFSHRKWVKNDDCFHGIEIENPNLLASTS